MALRQVGDLARRVGLDAALERASAHGAEQWVAVEHIADLAEALRERAYADDLAFAVVAQRLVLASLDSTLERHRNPLTVRSSVYINWGHGFGPRCACPVWMRRLGSCSVICSTTTPGGAGNAERWEPCRQRLLAESVFAGVGTLPTAAPRIQGDDRVELTG